jgi:hypothetical protein
MKSCRIRCYASLLLLFIITQTFAQDQRAFNQNASRSNHTRGLSISFSPVYSSALNNSNDSLLFRGSGAGFRFGADYFWNKAGIGFISGFGSSSPADAAINNFLKQSSIPSDQLFITKSNQQNMYLLLGPSVRFGNAVQLYAHAKAGLFINNSGLVSIQQRGSTKPAYRNESTGKSIYPGFQTGLNVQYSLKSDVWSFGIGADYMSTKTEVMNYDGRRGGGIEGLKLSQNINDIVAGITIRYTILSPRDQASGQSTGKRLLPTVNKREVMTSRDAQTGLASGKRVLPTVNKREIAIDEPGVQNAMQGCGAVTKKITNPDGTTEEMSFACTADALAYERQTPKRDFGDRATWSSSEPAFRSISNTSGSKGIVSGRLTWTSTGGGMGIVTNNMVGGAVRNGSTTMNSQTSSTRQTNQSSFGTLVRLSAREASSGMATGRRSRDAASGMATGKRQYEPVFDEQEDEVCAPWLATVKSNPLYKGNMQVQNNPLYKGNERTAGGADEDCDGIAGIMVSLVDIQSGAVVAKTKTETCGDFFFANVPEGTYIVKLSGSFTGKKGYDIYLKSKTDLAGGIQQSDAPVQLMLNTGDENNGMSQKAGISTSRSNIRTKTLTVIEADLDGDGEFELAKVLAGLSDGTTKDVTAFSRMSAAGAVKKVTVRGWDPKKKEAIAGTANSVNEYTISIDADNGVLLTNQYDNGKKEEIRVIAKISQHPNVVQFVVQVDAAGMDQKIKTKSNIKNDRVAAGDVTDDGATAMKMDQKIKTKSNIKNDRVAAGDVTDDGVMVMKMDQKIKTKSNIKNDRMAAGDVDGDGIWSPRSNIKMLQYATGDVDGDGKAEMTLGAAFVPGGGVISAAMSPGEPIPGIDVKLGKNPGGQSLQSTTSNSNGEFEFTKLEAGDYFITVEQKIIINDETIVTVTGDAAETRESNVDKEPQMRKGWDGVVKGGAINSRDNEMITMDVNEPTTFRWTPLVPKPKEPVTYKLRVWQLMQGQNGTQAMKSNTPIVEKKVIDVNEASVQGILTGPCKPPYLCDFIWSVQAVNREGKSINSAFDNQAWNFSVAQPDNTGGSVTKAQDHNSSRSNKTSSIVAGDPDDAGDPTKKTNPMPVRWSAPEVLTSILIEADLDGDGEYESNVSNKISDELIMDKDGNVTTPQQKAGVSTSRSNIRSRGNFSDKGDGLYVYYGTAVIDDKEVALKIISKSTHDMQMGAIRNLK